MAPVGILISTQGCIVHVFANIFHVRLFIFLKNLVSLCETTNKFPDVQIGIII